MFEKIKILNKRVNEITEETVMQNFKTFLCENHVKYDIPITPSESKHFKIAVDLNKIIQKRFPHFKTALVGGACRDLFFRKFFQDKDFQEINDLDFAIWSTKSNLGLNKKELQELLQYINSKSEFTVIDEGKFLHLKVFHKQTNYEVEYTSTRSETYRDINSRKPETQIGSIVDDIIRRDFTINAIYLDIVDVGSNTVTVSPKNEQTIKHIQDVKNKILTTTTDNPNVVFDEDTLRVLRAIRFSDKFEMTPEVEEIVREFPGERIINQASMERISDELGKILEKGNVDYLFKSGFINKIISEFSDFTDKEYGENEVQHIINTIKVAREKAPKDSQLIFLLTSFLHDIGKANTGTYSDEKERWQFFGHENESAIKAKQILTRYKFPNKIIDRVVGIIENHMVTKFFDKVPEKSIMRWLIRMYNQRQKTPNIVEDVLRFNIIDWGGKPAEWKEQNKDMIQQERVIAKKVLVMYEKMKNIIETYKDELKTISARLGADLKRGLLSSESIPKAKEKLWANFILKKIKQGEG